MTRAAVFIDGGYLQKSLQAQWGGVKIDLERLSDLLVEKANGGERLRTYYYDCPPYQGNPPTDEERTRSSNYDRFRLKLESLPRFSYRAGRLARRRGAWPRYWYALDDGSQVEVLIFRHPDTNRIEGMAVCRDEGAVADENAVMAPSQAEVLGFVSGCHQEREALQLLAERLDLPDPPVRVVRQGEFVFDQKRVDMLLGIDLIHHSSKNHITNAVIITGDSDFIPAIQMAKNDGVVVTLVHSEHPKQRAHRELQQYVDERIVLSDEIINACGLSEWPREPTGAPNEPQNTDSAIEPSGGEGCSKTLSAQTKAVVDAIRAAEEKLDYVGVNYFCSRWVGQAPFPTTPEERQRQILLLEQLGLVERYRSDDGYLAVRCKKS